MAFIGKNYTIISMHWRIQELTLGMGEGGVTFLTRERGGCSNKCFHIKPEFTNVMKSLLKM